LKIGLSQRVLFHKERAYDSIEHGWYSYLKDHTLVFIPNRTDQDFNKLADDLDVLILTGGDDSLIRRTTEIKIATHMLMQSKPIVGICHGAFLLTELLGGKVVQKDDHVDTEHSIQYNNQLYRVNSFHNLAIEQVHVTAKSLAVDEDGACEAWIDKNIAAIVWHPERMQTPWIPDEISYLLKKNNNH
jgi:N5-(cytidine 5'-diphosphoramidyl)-L-glutamine hydrolase